MTAAPAFPLVDAEQIDTFVRALFRYADPGGYVQLRAFRDDAAGAWRAEMWPAPRINGDLSNIVTAAVGFAGKCAAATEAVVFCPPVATLNDAIHAAEKDTHNGIALSVDCDRAPFAALRILSAILGPPTIVVASGGEWIDPSTGEAQPKLHLHWRLSRPTRNFQEHVKLKEARRKAIALIGGDASGAPLVHPLRWPGSWHRKREPLLATIIERNADAEIELDDALLRLDEELKKRTSDTAGGGGRHDKASSGPDANGGADGRHQETAALMATIIRAEDYHGPIASLAMRFLVAGTTDAMTVVTLRSVMMMVDPGIRDYKDGILHKDRWLSRYNDIPRAVSTARAKLNEETAASSEPGARRLTSLTVEELLEMEIPEREMLLDPIIPSKGLVMIHSKRGVGKTFLSLEIAYAIASGGKCLRWSAPKPRRVLFIDGEMPLVSLKERLARIALSSETEPPSPEYLRIIAADYQENGIPDLATPEGVKAIEEHLADGAEAVITDNLSTLCRSGKENESASWTPIQEWALSLRRREMSVVFVHHAGKDGAQRGTSKREDVLDTVIALRRPDDYSPTDGARFEVHLEKARGVHGDKAKPFEARLDIRDDVMTWAMRDLDDVESQRAADLSAEGFSLREIAEEMEISKSKVERLLKKAPAKSAAAGGGKGNN